MSKWQEYITRMQAYEAVEKQNGSDQITPDCYNEIMKEIGEIPEADVFSVRYAKWERKKKSHIYHCAANATMICSFCKNEYLMAIHYKFHFCPYCGSIMK